jgi:hypothetical protein
MPGGLLPTASAVLSSIPQEYLHHQAHARRHPASAYGTSLKMIASHWIKVLEELHKLQMEYIWQKKDERFPKVLDEYRQLLHRVHEHLDACQSTLRCLCRPEEGPDTPLDVPFMNKAKAPGWNRFREVTKQYNDDNIGLLVNTLKHSQGELCGIYFWSPGDFRPGYFLRDVLPGGSLGPHRKLHSNGNTAFSFARDMLMHVWQIYRISEALCEAVTKFLRTRHSFNVQPDTTGTGSTEWESVVSACAMIRPEFFPDETTKPYPLVLHNHRDSELTLEYPSSARGIRVSLEAEIRVTFTVDQHHLSNKLPYMAARRGEA